MSEILYKLVRGQRVPMSEEEVAMRLAEEEAWVQKKATETQLQAAHDAASAVFESMPRWKRAFWTPVREEVSKSILAGDIAGAVEILTDMPAFYEGAEADRQMFLALFA